MTVVVGVDGAGRTHRLREHAAAATTPVWWVSGTGAAGLASARAEHRLVIVDDAHRLDAATLLELSVAAREGVPMVISRRPTIDRPELADLDEAAAVNGVEFLGALDRDGVGTLVARTTGRPVSPETATAVFEASAGLPAVAAAVATAAPDVPAPALLARVQRRFAVLDHAVVRTARVLALRLDLGDPVLAAAAGLDVGDVAGALRTLRDEGLLVPDGDRMIPAVAAAVLAELPAAERRRIHDAVAGSLVAARADPVAAAGQLRAARAFTQGAAAVYAEAGERLRFSDPATAAGWFDDAADAGADPARLAAGRAEANALLGLPVDVDQFVVRPADGERMALVAGAVAAHQGRTARAAELLLAAGATGPALAVPALVATGRIVDARAAAAACAAAPLAKARTAAGAAAEARTAAAAAEARVTTGAATPAVLSRFAEGVLAAGEPARALPLLIEAAEALERGAPAVVLPDTPHAVAAVVAVAAGDVSSAEYLLTRARAARVGGPAADERHRLLLAWSRMRTGSYETALHELLRPAAAELPGRERLLRAALAAGIARRRGDIAGLRDAWSGIEPLLARRTVDLWQLEAVEELAVAATRLRRRGRIEPVLDLLDGIIEGLDRPVTWSVSLGWIRLHMAIVTEDSGAAAEVAGRMSALVAGDVPPRARRTSAASAAGAGRPLAQCTAAVRWAAVLAGQVEPEAVLAATEDLFAAELPWEASRLAGQAAIRTADPTAARRLLERARELSEPDAAAAADAAGGLSEREVTVARLVLAGSTHREIGAQLYIAPKTVEHHVARIRGKLRANTRAELVAMLREMFGD